MGNLARRKRRPKGINRPRPEERAIQSLLLEDDRVKRAVATRIRQARHRSEIRRAEHLTQSLASAPEDQGDIAMTERTTNRVSKRLAAYVVGGFFLLNGLLCLSIKVAVGPTSCSVFFLLNGSLCLSMKVAVDPTSCYSLHSFTVAGWDLWNMRNKSSQHSCDL